ncbi:hypothetical protein IMZ31_23315 (plasmid) [Pontibacillus sp. ALD_SL1]|uniref:hypothetical protein n=1 Tax=Pontibacillus sp. ALD_SL1 TaxID=2777185 RepID=UPI001A96C8A5|nr:hypothetical protein [Pontibacillus sp. ALD_SL1]QST02382.1 hypothetical protein IMZ31_23315 [Pontibacillus sp. ALD_SL1]
MLAFTVPLEETNDRTSDGVNVFFFRLESEMRSLGKPSYSNCVAEGKQTDKEERIKQAIAHLFECSISEVENLQLEETTERIGKGKTRKYEYKRHHLISFTLKSKGKSEENFSGEVTDCGVLR